MAKTHETEATVALPLIGRRWRGVAATVLVGAVLALVLAGPGRLIAATNQATDPGGGSVSLAPSGSLTVNAVTLALIKQARDLAGTVLTAGFPVVPGQQIYFVLYVDNVTSVIAQDIRVTDLIDQAAFTYTPNSLESTVVPSGSSNAVIWAGSWTALSDGVGGPDDLASVTDSGAPPGLDRVTVGAVSAQANQTLDIPAGMLRAIRFRVTVN